MTTPRVHEVPVSQGGDTRAYTHPAPHQFKFGYCMCQCGMCATASNCICPNCKCRQETEVIHGNQKQETTDAR